MSEEVSLTVAATQDMTLFAPVSYGIQDDHTPKFGEEVAPTLRRGGEGGTHQHVATAGDGLGPIAIQGDGGRSSGGQNGCGVSEDGASYTLNATDRHSVAVDFRNGAVAGEGDPTGTLAAKPNGGQSLNFQPGVLEQEGGGDPERVAHGYVVRRLTPLECERLQGMPDDHTRIPWKGKPAEECPDGPRYKAIGNSMAVPVMRWLGERLDMVDEVLSDENPQSEVEG